MEDSLVVRRFAIKYDPPTLVVEYKTPNGLFLKKIKIKSHPLDEEKLCDKLIRTYPLILGPDKVDREQLLDLIKLLLSQVNENLVQDPIATLVDLNKADDETLAKVKQKMDINFSKNRILPNDPNFEWDKQVDFQPPQEACDWDEEEDD